MTQRGVECGDGPASAPRFVSHPPRFSMPDAPAPDASDLAASAPAASPKAPDPVLDEAALDAARMERLARSWDANAGAWTAAVTRGTESRRAGTDAAVVHATIRALADSVPGTVLDVGCGEGWLIRTLRGEGVRMAGVDGSAELARRAGARHLTYAQIVEHPSRLGGRFSVAVFSFALLDDDPASILRAVASRLVPDGRIVIQTVHPHRQAPPYASGWREEAFAGFGDAAFEPMPWYFHTLGEWLEQVHAAGLALERIDEPVHPDSGEVLSLVLTARLA